MTIRGEILDAAKNLTEGDRNKSYGDPWVNLDCFMQMVTSYMTCIGKTRAATSPVDGAVIMCLAKISRIAINPQHDDSFVDLTAYAAIAGEMSKRRAEIIASQEPSK